jgi:quinohemoprotein ethanol dehydrogenase
MRRVLIFGGTVFALSVSLGAFAAKENPTANSAGRFVDTSGGGDWPGFGRTYGEQHYSPLADINRSSATTRKQRRCRKSIHAARDAS